MSQEEEEEQEEQEEQSSPNFILQKRLTGFYLGRVTLVVSRSCLEGVLKVSGMYREDVWNVSGRCLEDVWNPADPYQPDQPNLT